MESGDISPDQRPTLLEEGRQPSHSSNLDAQRRTVLGDGGTPSNASNFAAQTDGAINDGSHIQVEEPPRPQLHKKQLQRGESTKSLNDALRLARSREEQETLLGDGEEADDDGCFPPRESDEPRARNPHQSLPVYTTIQKVRRLIITSIGRHQCGCCTRKYVADNANHRRSILRRSAEESAHERGRDPPARRPSLRP